MRKSNPALWSTCQHQASYTLYKQGGYYYDIENKKRCEVVAAPAINASLGHIDAKCGAAKGISGSPMLDASDTEGTPYAIALMPRRLVPNQSP
jgi:hypothetical protein